MFEVEITETPASVPALLGRTGVVWEAGIWLFTGRVQNRGPATVYRTYSTGVPNAAQVRGFRHPVASDVTIEVWGDTGGTQWFWTAQGSGTATLIFEDVAGVA